MFLAKLATWSNPDVSSIPPRSLFIYSYMLLFPRLMSVFSRASHFVSHACHWRRCFLLLACCLLSRTAWTYLQLPRAGVVACSQRSQRSRNPWAFTMFQPQKPSKTLKPFDFWFILANLATKSDHKRPLWHPAILQLFPWTLGRARHYPRDPKGKS